METHISKIESAILRLRFTGSSLGQVAQYAGTTRKNIRYREMVAMRTLRRAGFTDHDIRVQFGG